MKKGATSREDEVLQVHLYSAWICVFTFSMECCGTIGEEPHGAGALMYGLLSTIRSCKTLHTWLPLTRDVKLRMLAVASRFYSRCVACGTTAGGVDMHELHPLQPVICYYCGDRPEFKTVSKTVASRVYRRNVDCPRALELVPELRHHDIITGRWGIYNVYLLSDVLKLPERKHRAKKAGGPESEARKEERRIELATAMEKAGVEIRHDSKLCAKYISGSRKFDLDYVVERMCQMKLLHEYWHFKKYLRNIIRDACDMQERIPSEEAVEMAEGHALDDHGDAYPNMGDFPWQK
jgi:hypothetical protein